MASEPASLPPVHEPPEQAAQMNTQTFMILLGVLILVGVFVAFVSKALTPQSATADTKSPAITALTPQPAASATPPADAVPDDSTPPATDEAPATDPQE